MFSGEDLLRKVSDIIRNDRTAWVRPPAVTLLLMDLALMGKKEIADDIIIALDEVVQSQGEK